MNVKLARDKNTTMPPIEVSFKTQGVMFAVNPFVEDKTWFVEREGDAEPPLQTDGASRRR